MAIPLADPVADPTVTFTCGKARFTVLTDRLVRCEYADDGAFEDRPTVAIANRRLAAPKVTTARKGDGIIIDTGALKLVYTGGLFDKKTLSIEIKAAKTTWHYGDEDKTNLGGTHRTLDGFRGPEKDEWKQDKKGVWKPTGKTHVPPMPGGLLSKSGWAVIDDSQGVCVERAINGRPLPVARLPGDRVDIYVVAYGKEFKACLKDASLVFGRTPLPPRYALGYWFSRYWAYTDREFEDLVDQFERRGVPLDVLVMDMDWHKPGWTGYSFDKDLFPDHKDLMEKLRKRGIKITCNLHPADGVGDNEDCWQDFLKSLGDPKKVVHEPLVNANGVTIAKAKVPFDPTDPAFIDAYFKVLHRPLEKDGVDFWWMDWQQGTTSKIPGLDPLPWLNIIHWDDQEQNPLRKGRRPMCFSRFGGIGSGRYPVGFSGDTHACWESLAYQPGFTAQAANTLYGTWSHDIGGHLQDDGKPVDPQLYLRWVQYGVFSPILRTHSTKRPWSDRRLWAFPEPYSQFMEQALVRRYELVPYLYAAWRQQWESGLALCRPLYLHHPDLAEAYKNEGVYYMGDDLLCAPVTTPGDAAIELTSHQAWLPPGDWIDTVRGCAVKGGEVLKADYAFSETPIFVKPGTVIAEQLAPKRLNPGSYNHPVFICWPLAAGGNSTGELYEDDGETTGYQDGQQARIPLRQEATADGRRIVVGPAAGTFRGFVRKRPVSLILPMVAPPTHVKLDGKEMLWSPSGRPGTWTFDGDECRLRVELAGADVCAATTVEIVGLHPVPDGLPAVLRRLRTLMSITKNASPVHVVHADERLPIRLGQLGNRVSRKPATYGEEIARLRVDLVRLEEVLPAVAKALRAGVTKDSHEAMKGNLFLADEWDRAGKLLAAMRKAFPAFFADAKPIKKK